VFSGLALCFTCLQALTVLNQSQTSLGIRYTGILNKNATFSADLLQIFSVSFPHAQWSGASSK
jgi:hypothetical protein